jgi:hypothetical protein
MVAISTPEFKSFSQAGQDRFVHTLLPIRDGTYLDVGANNPITINNSYGLEVLGWDGLLVDNSGESMIACERERSGAFYLTDAAASQNWQAALAQAALPTDRLSYLSLDIDFATLECLKNLPLSKLRFSVLTVETDEYRQPGRRDTILDIMRFHGYDVLCADVCNDGLSFEIWACDPGYVNPALADKFRRSQPTEWREFFK